MRIRIISSREEICTLNSNERIVHLAFKPSIKDIFALLETCPKLEIIQLPESYRCTTPKSIEMFLEMKRVHLIEGDVCDHRKDVDEYCTVSSSVIEKIRELESSKSTNIGNNIKKRFKGADLPGDSVQGPDDDQEWY